MFLAPTYAALLDAVDNAQGSVAKGKSLEDLLAYLLEEVPGYQEMERNAVNAFGTEELDIAVIHSCDAAGLAFLPSIVLVECKNWSHPVDSAAVSYFASRVKNRGCEVGILVAASGITGDPHGPTAAQFEGAIALAKDGIKVLVVTLEDLRTVTSIDDFVGLLRRRLLRVIASGTYLP